VRSRYEGYIPADWDRSDPAGDLIDLATGARIRDLEHFGGWMPTGDGKAMRDSEYFMLMDQQRRQVDSASDEILLLFQ
jgi:hypothetical protein